jgi:serine/threonine protein kinase
MLTAEGHICLVDFGVAERSSGMLDGSRGTAGYIAPESLLESCYAAGAADMYSFGVVLFQMVLCPAVCPFPGWCSIPTNYRV